MAKEKSATKVCKYCKTEIPHDAKVCPQCRKKQGTGCLSKILIVIFALIIIVIISQIMGDDESTNDTNQTENNQTSETKDKTDYSVGESFSSDNIKISFLDADKYDSDNEFMQPEDGNKYVYAEFEIENLDDSDLSIGSWSFTCYADDYVCDETYFDDNSLSVIDSISAGKKIKGKVYYEVPENSESIILEYESDFWTEKKINFIIK